MESKFVHSSHFGLIGRMESKFDIICGSLDKRLISAVIENMSLYVKELCDLTVKEKVKLLKEMRLFTRFNVDMVEVHNWGDYGDHSKPIIQKWAYNPSEFKDTMGKSLGLPAHTDPGAFTTPLQDLDGPGLQVLEDGKWELGLQFLKDAIIFFGIDRDTVPEKAMGKSLGLPAHTDRDAFTTPLQDLQVAGLQDVEPHPGAFVIKIGDQLQVTNHGVSAEAIKEFAYSQFAVKEKKKLYSDDYSKTTGLEQLTTGWTFGTWDPQPVGSSVSNFSGIFSCSSASGSSSISSHLWLLDSGATHHVCCSPTSFQSLVLSVNYDVTLPNGHTVSIAGTGSVRLSDHLTLENVLFVPEFHFNLVSVSALTQQHHYTVIFTSDGYGILDLTQGQMIGMGRQSGNLYILDSTSLFSSFP